MMKHSLFDIQNILNTSQLFRPGCTNTVFSFLTCTESTHPTEPLRPTDSCGVQYSRTSMARTSLGPWKFVREMGSSSQWDLIMAPGQEANGNNLWKCFRSSTK